MIIPKFASEKAFSYACSMCHHFITPDNVIVIGQGVSLDMGLRRLVYELTCRCPRCGKSQIMVIGAVNWKDIATWALLMDRSAEMVRVGANIPKDGPYPALPDELQATLSLAMEVLNVGSGRDAPYGGGTPCVMLTLSHRGNVQRPISFGMRDASMLLRGLIRALEEHDDPLARKMSNFFIPDDESGDTEQEVDAQLTMNSIPPPVQEAALPATTAIPENVPFVQMLLRERQDGNPKEVNVIGTYKKNRRIILMCRFASDENAHERLMAMGTKNTVNAGPCRDNETLPIEDWPKYLSLPDQTKFRLGGSNWTKLSLQQIRRIVGNKTFTLNHAGKPRLG